MILQPEQMGPGFAARIDGLDLSAPISKDQARQIQDLLHQHKVILFRGQKVDPDGFLALARAFGDLEPFFLSNYSLNSHPEIYILSNMRRDGSAVGRDGAGTHWHSDSTFTERPSAATLLQAITVPDEGGDTLFSDVQAAFDELDPDEQARLVGLKAAHRYQKREFLFTADRPKDERARQAIRDLQELRLREEASNFPSPTEKASGTVPDQWHPLVRTHPVTGRRGLYLNEEMIAEIEGMDPAAMADLVRKLCDHATQERFIYRHQWQAHDIVVWDNAAVMHAVTFTPPEKDRMMYRLTIKGQVPV